MKHGVDVRCLRYPGLISPGPCGGGTTDYSVDFFFHALSPSRSYECFVRPDTVLPLMYMDDAVDATLQLMDAPAEKITVRTAYNIASLSFSAKELEQAIAERVPGFTATYVIDPLRQAIADSWPAQLEDNDARRDWNWNPKFLLPQLCDEMLKRLKEVSNQ